jgi:hypothetical protein
MMERLSIKKTKHCLSEEDLLRYVTDTLTSDRRLTAEKHLGACVYCLQRSAEVFRLTEAARKQACPHIIPQLVSYLEARMAGNDIEAVSAHLLICDECFERYDRLVEAQMDTEWEQWTRTEILSPRRTVGQIILGWLTNFPQLQPLWVPSVQAVRLSAKPEKPDEVRVDNWQQLIKEDVTATLALDAQDHLLVALESARYDVRHVTVSLREKTDHGDKEVKATVTDDEGQADFGPITAIPKPDREGYRLGIKGLSELPRSGEDGHEETYVLSLETFKSAQRFFEEHHATLLKEYGNKYVAIVANQVVDADDDFSALAERVYARYGYGPIYMPKVVPEPFTVAIPSPRLGSPVKRPQGETQ